MADRISGDRNRVPGRFRCLSLLAVGLSLSACGFDPCGDAPEATGGNAPVLVDVELANQLEGDPSTLVFAAEFSDSDGNVGTGDALVHLNGATDPSLSVALPDVFRQSALAVDARAGLLSLTLRLTEVVDDGSDLRVGLRLVDGDGQASNCFPVEVEFSVTEIAQR